MGFSSVLSGPKGLKMQKFCAAACEAHRNGQSPQAGLASLGQFHPQDECLAMALIASPNVCNVTFGPPCIIIVSLTGGKSNLTQSVFHDNWSTYNSDYSW